jgi:DNA-binding response OmpR family regulator
MKIYTFNIPQEDPCMEMLKRYGSCAEWGRHRNEGSRKKEAVVFARCENAESLLKVCRQCEQDGDWCLAWVDSEILSDVILEIPTSLIDFVGKKFEPEELELRLMRIMHKKSKLNNVEFLVTDDLLYELTKKQLIIYQVLKEAGDAGINKGQLEEQMWRNVQLPPSRASGLNVHILHLRKKLEKFNYAICYDKDEKVYRLKKTSRIINKTRAVDLSH